MAKINFVVESNSSLDLNALIKQHFTYTQMAKKLKLNRSQLYRILLEPEQLTYYRMKEIINLCGYELELTIKKKE